VRRKRIVWCLAILVVFTAGVGWLLRDRLLAQYYVYRLVHADDAALGYWVATSRDWGAAIEPALFAELAGDDPARSERAGAALAGLHQDESNDALLSLLAAKFENLGRGGQDWALQQVGAREPSPVTQEKCRQLLMSAVQNSSPAIRQRAIGLALKLTGESLEFLAPLANDSDPTVRRAVVLALGANREWLSDDELLPRLHDPEREVQRLARMALRSRGLSEEQVHMGRLLTDPRPAARLDLLALLYRNAELDLSAWLMRLTRDASPAVRAATVRTVGELRIFQLIDRINEMAEADPDASVRPLARFYLTQIRSAEPPTPIDRPQP
jgi:hypothetical protein